MADSDLDLGGIGKRNRKGFQRDPGSDTIGTYDPCTYNETASTDFDKLFEVHGCKMFIFCLTFVGRRVLKTNLQIFINIGICKIYIKT